MEKSRFKISLRVPITLFSVIIGITLIGCDTSAVAEDFITPHDAIHDPTQPVTATGFSPDSGTVGTQLLINGSNFGSDVSILKVTIDDVPLTVIGSDGSQIYALLGKELEPGEDKGIINVFVGEEQQVKVEVPGRFIYKVEPYVVTLAGWKDEKGNSASVDGNIKEAQFYNVHRVTLDQYNNLYALEEGGGLRFIPNDHSYVSTVYWGSGDMTRMTSVSFSKDFKRLFITNSRDDNSWSKVGVMEILYNEEKGDFTGGSKAMVNVDKCFGGDFHPHDDIFFYGSTKDGVIYKWLGVNNPIKGNDERNSKQLFKLKERETETSIHFHPNGNFAYILTPNKHQILKSNYNWTTQELEPATVFVGSGKEGSTDGVGKDAQIYDARQGTFDEEGNFYIVEHGNHTVRKITPTGIVTLFAGIPGNKGNVDGSFTEARFNEPQGIVYDKDNKIFYIADRANRSVRMIVMPKN